MPVWRGRPRPRTADKAERHATTAREAPRKGAETIAQDEVQDASADELCEDGENIHARARASQQLRANQSPSPLKNDPDERYSEGQVKTTFPRPASFRSWTQLRKHPLAFLKFIWYKQFTESSVCG